MRRILLIDDDQDLSDTIKSVLEYDGFDVLLSNDPQKGIDMAKEQNSDMILMDVMLPGMNGAEAVKILKSTPIVRDIPVIFLTALMSNSDRGAQQEGLNVDGVSYKTLGKPFENEKLLEMVRSTLGD
jgi:CheY-like chemotaxis protein